MKEETKHTPTPWIVKKHSLNGSNFSIETEDFFICKTDLCLDEEANAEFIVTACNNHDRLVEENKRMREALEKIAFMEGEDDLGCRDEWAEAAAFNRAKAIASVIITEIKEQP